MLLLFLFGHNIFIWEFLLLFVFQRPVTFLREKVHGWYIFRDIVWFILFAFTYTHTHTHTHTHTLANYKISLSESFLWKLWHLVLECISPGSLSVYPSIHPSTHPAMSYVIYVKVVQLCPTLCSPMDCSQPDSSVHGILQAKNIGVGCYCLLQGIFPTQGSNPGLLHCRQILYHLSYPGKSSNLWGPVKNENAGTMFSNY